MRSAQFVTPCHHACLHFRHRMIGELGSRGGTRQLEEGEWCACYWFAARKLEHISTPVWPPLMASCKAVNPVHAHENKCYNNRRHEVRTFHVARISVAAGVQQRGDAECVA